MEYVYHMRDPKRAVLFLQNLHRELIGILDSGVILLMDNGITDWYVFVYADHSAGREHVDALLADKGKRSKYTVQELSTHPKKTFMCSGTFEQVMDGLDALGETQRELRAKIQLN